MTLRIKPTSRTASHLRAVPGSESAFLAFLGRRVRGLRARRGMTRKMMANEARVSERHLAQLESGEGNISIVLLARIAGALNVSLAEMFSPEKEMRREKALIQRFLERLPAHRMEDVLQRLAREFGDQEKTRRKRVALVGIRGAGKSTLGAKLAAELKLPFIELDHEIEGDAGIPLSEIFSLYGQAGFRMMEKRVLQRVLENNERTILSVGGGIVSEKETYDFLLSHCYTVWVKAQPEEYMARVTAQGDFRVMGGSKQAMEELRGILEAREPLYRKADLCLDTTGDSVDESLAKLKAGLEVSQVFDPNQD